MKDEIEKSENATFNSFDLHSNPYFSYFNNIPLALWVEDFSFAKKRIEEKAKEFHTDISTYIAENPTEAIELAKMVVIKDVNQTAVALYKAKNKEDLLKNLDKVFTEKSYEKFAFLLIQIICGKKEVQIEAVNKTFEGDEFDISLKFTVIDPSLENVIIAIEDISERVKFKKQLANSELRYKEAQAISKLGSWSYDFKTNEIYWSDEVFKIIGLQPQDLIPDLRFFSSLIVDEDRENATKFSIDYLLKNRNQQLTYRIITPEKKLKYINEHRTVIVENNRIVKIAGTSQDITKNVLNNQKLNITKNLLSDTNSVLND